MSKLQKNMYSYHHVFRTFEARLVSLPRSVSLPGACALSCPRSLAALAVCTGAIVCAVSYLRVRRKGGRSDAPRAGARAPKRLAEAEDDDDEPPSPL